MAGGEDPFFDGVAGGDDDDDDDDSVLALALVPECRENTNLNGVNRITSDIKNVTIHHANPKRQR